MKCSDKLTSGGVEPRVAKKQQASSSNVAWGSIFQGGHGSVRFCYGSCTQRFEQFRFWGPTVPLWKGVLSISVEVSQKGTVPVPENGSSDSGFVFGSWKNLVNLFLTNS